HAVLRLDAVAVGPRRDEGDVAVLAVALVGDEAGAVAVEDEQVHVGVAVAGDPDLDALAGVEADVVGDLLALAQAEVAGVALAAQKDDGQDDAADQQQDADHAADDGGPGAGAQAL